MLSKNGVCVFDLPTRDGVLLTLHIKTVDGSRWVTRCRPNGDGTVRWLYSVPLPRHPSWDHQNNKQPLEGLKKLDWGEVAICSDHTIFQSYLEKKVA